MREATTNTTGEHGRDDGIEATETPDKSRTTKVEEKDDDYFTACEDAQIEGTTETAQRAETGSRIAGGVLPRRW